MTFRVTQLDQYAVVHNADPVHSLLGGSEIFPTCVLVFRRRGSVVFPFVIRQRGANSIFVGRTPHEMYDERCRGVHQLSRRPPADPLAAAPPHPCPAPRPWSSPWPSTYPTSESDTLDPEIEQELTVFESTVEAVPRGRGRGGRLPRLPAEPGHLRPAPGRPPPDGAGQDPLRADHARAARDARPSSARPTRAAGATSPPARTCSSTSCRSSRRPRCCGILAAVGLTTREACGDTVRNVMGCHLAGACPLEVLDITPWAEATARYLLRNPYAQRLPRKFKINFSGCATDCGQAMFNDVGVIGVTRPLPDGTVEPGFRVFIAGGLGANPHPAQALEEFTAREDLLPTIEAILRTFDHYGNRDNKLRARMKWLVDTMGIDELRAPHPQGAPACCAPRRAGPAAFPRRSLEHGDAPAGMTGDGVVEDLPGTRAGAAARHRPVPALGRRPTWCAARPTAPCAPTRRARSATSRPTSSGPSPTSSATSRSTSGSPTARTSCSATSPRPTCAASTTGSPRSAWPSPGAELARDVVACPGADTCNLAVTQSRGLADDIGRALEEAGLADVGGVRINISGCTNSCGQHHISDIGFFGARAPGPRPRRPGLPDAARRPRRRHAGRVRRQGRAAAGQARGRGRRAGRRPLRRRARGRRDVRHLARALRRRRRRSAPTLKDLDVFPTPEEAPDFYVDFDETGPYVAEVGESECAT